MTIISITLAHDIDYGTAFAIKELSDCFRGTDITILHSGKLVSGNNLLNLLALAAKTGTPCLLIASGASESQAIEELKLVLAVSNNTPPFPSKLARGNLTTPASKTLPK
ncbi:MAG: HPr family phosphocarrier protein [Puniceicoccales bacterium]|jgi:phosphotransferase system HPr-like phosphotransfer protein|nr:HPr family phosphocarrier protein [Puniceicoccales bacterium]